MYGKSNSTAYIAFLDVFSPFYNANVSFGDVSKINVVFGWVHEDNKRIVGELAASFAQKLSK